jgi:hypothetical protein
MTNAQSVQHGGERRYQLAKRLGQYLTSLQFRYEGSQSLPESNEHPVLLDYELGAEPGAAPVVPDRAAQRRQPFPGRHLAHALEVVSQLGLFGFQLRFGRQMLQSTAATDSEVGASRDNP